VEDNPDDIELTLRAFKRNAISNEVVVKRDGAEALDFFFGKEGIADKGDDGLPAIILLDLKLPKIDGLEVLKRIKTDRRTKLIPVVVLTSSKEQADVIDGYKLGCNSYIHKPVDFNQFAEIVRQLGLYWLVLNEAPRHNKGF